MTGRSPKKDVPAGDIGEDRPTLAVRKNDKGQVFSHIRQKWLAETPEERVRQAYVVTLHGEYGFDLDQMDEELHVAGRGSARARADMVIWRTTQDRADRKTPLIVVECKADNITIKARDYAQGEAYALYCNAPFFVTHNNRETRYWRTRKDRMPGNVEEIENIPHAAASDKDIQELIAKLKTFKEDEFADLLHSCHNVIRNREHLDPAAAFDEIAKVLFIKVWVERELRRKHQRQNLFSADWLDSQLGENPLQELFRQTKEDYREDRIFDERERLNLKLATGREIVRLLERYNLSDTSEDVKGIVLPEGIFNNPSLAYVREFCEDRARILAVVSLPQETFYSSGATVKASLLFLQKFTAEEQADFNTTQEAAATEVEAKYADEIAVETARLEAAIEGAKEAKDAEAHKAAQKELRAYLKRMDNTKAGEARALLKERFDYPIFLYEAEKVGITATGEPDANELYPNDSLPAGMNPEETCLELYRRFQVDPQAFFLEKSA